MRNKMIIMLLFAFVICLTGCGSKEEIPQGPVEVSVLINSEKDDIEEESLEDESEVVPEAPVKFDCLDEIKAASPDSGLIQIDDMILQYGSTGAEVFEAVSQSECEYTAEYNENQLIPAGECEMVYFKKNGESYFSIRLQNMGSETIELKDCVIDIISALKASKGNIYYAGASGEVATYSAVKEIMSDYESEREFSGHDSRDNKRLAVLYKIPDSNDIVNSFEDILYIYYIFDSNTNELNSIMICDYDNSGIPW